MKTELKNKATDPWDITLEIRQLAKKIGKEIRESREKFEKTPRKCPNHEGKFGKFVRYEGAYTRVVAVFECSEGEEFFIS